MSFKKKKKRLLRVATKYPNIANKMDDLERRLHKLENGQKTDKPKRQINMRVKPLTRTK